MPNLIVRYIADVQRSHGRRRLVLVLGGTVFTAVACLDAYLLGRGLITRRISPSDAVAMFATAAAVGRAGKSAYLRRCDKKRAHTLKESP